MARMDITKPQEIIGSYVQPSDNPTMVDLHINYTVHHQLCIHSVIQ